MAIDPFDAALDLLRRLPPSKTSENITALTQIAPDLTEELLESVDVPLAVKKCSKTKRDFLCCDYNRDGDSYRSPWSNEFEPPLDDGEGVVPSERVRKMEIRANEAIDVYRDLYVDSWDRFSSPQAPLAYRESNSHNIDTTKAVSPPSTSGISIHKALLAVFC